MKRSTVFSVLTISALLAGAPVLSEAGRYGSYGVDLQGGEHEQYAPGGQKDECLLVARNCANETETIQQRIDRLNYEILKGTDVYTPEELNTLKRQLNDEYKYL